MSGRCSTSLPDFINWLRVIMKLKSIHIQRIGFVLLVGGFAAFMLIWRGMRTPPANEPTPTPTIGITSGKQDYEIVTKLAFDEIPAIDDPQVYSLEEADREYLDGELVLGVKINGESRAYSSGTLDAHEIVNDELGGREIAVTWSPLCFTGIVYSREIGGDVFDFGVSGKLIMNNLVMYDRQTESLWAQILGEAVEGPLEGAQLEFIPSVHTTWGDWKERNPDTTALVKGRIGDYSDYGAYFRSNSPGVTGRTHKDNRLKIKEFVIGAADNNSATAYPFGFLGQELVVNELLGEEPVLVVFNDEAGSGAVFSRELEDGRILTFSSNGGTILVDEETGSTWEGMEGLAIEGPLAGTRLKPVRNTLAFWFAWKDWYPHTSIYGFD